MCRQSKYTEAVGDITSMSRNIDHMGSRYGIKSFIINDSGTLNKWIGLLGHQLRLQKKKQEDGRK
jgi:hypothetical protein